MPKFDKRRVMHAEAHRLHRHHAQRQFGEERDEPAAR